LTRSDDRSYIRGAVREVATPEIPVNFEKIAGAGRRALGAGDMRVAAKLLEFASALARDDPDSNQRLQLVPDLGLSLEEIGKLRRAEEMFAEVEDGSNLARFEVASLRDYTRATPQSFDTLKAEAAEPREELEPAERARAAILAAEVNWTEGKYGAMNELLKEAEDQLKEPDNPEQQPLLNSILGWKARALLLGPEKADKAIKSCDDFEDASRSSSRAVVLAVRAGLRAMRDEIDEARTDYQESRRIGEAFGLNAWLAALPLYSGPVELLDGQAAEAERQLRYGYDALESMGDRSRRATTAAFLAHALYEQQRDDEAGKFAEESRKLASKSDVFTQVVWRGAMAKVLARAGDCEGAKRLAEESENRAKKTDSPNLKGDALLDWAEVLRFCETPEVAAKKAEEAVEKYEEGKHNVAAARRAKAFITRLTA
jgi:ATP/maltotriose-dependent transcriptional regulator MalT